MITLSCASVMIAVIGWCQQVRGNEKREEDKREGREDAENDVKRKSEGQSN